MREMKEVIDRIEYHLFTNYRGPAIGIKDLDTGAVVSTLNYPSPELAQEAYDTLTAAMWQIAARGVNPDGL